MSCDSGFVQRTNVGIDFVGRNQVTLELENVREWQGEMHVVDVMEVGYRWNGERYSSLSAVAREITGTRWSGPRFFGLKGTTRGRG